MRGLKTSVAAKAAAVILSALLLATTVICILGVSFMYDAGFYNKDKSEAVASRLEDELYADMYAAASLYDDGVPLDMYYQSGNLFYTIESSDGVVLDTNYRGEKYQLSVTDTVSLEYYSDNVRHEKKYTVTLYLAEELTKSDSYSLITKLTEFGYGVRYGAIVVGAVSGILAVILIIYLFCAAGWREGQDYPRPSWLDRLPFDLVTAVYALAVVLAAVAVSHFFSFSVVALVVVFLLSVVGYLLVLSWLITLAVRVKCGRVFRNTVIWRILSWLGRGVRYVWRALPFVWKTVLAVGIYTFIGFIVVIAAGYASVGGGTMWLIGRLIAVPAVILSAIALRRLQAGAARIAAGELDYKIDASHMFWDFRRSAEDLNSINRGMSLAVNERLKSERFKTELITNVSHDIKTPLTSIINYVDLIKKEEPGSEKTGEYIEVLDRQSQRLKKLIEDLVEASKASTGNLAVNPVPCEMGVLLEQTAGEYGEKLEAKGLTLVLNHPGDPVTVMADGRHLWRIFDNLMNNVCKYAQSGTRVYLDLKTAGGKARVTLRNISASPLNISGEELMERFVRGDSSRNTEGSGLGLSIARSLTELQKGTLDILVDGDLFKIELSFPLAP